MNDNQISDIKKHYTSAKLRSTTSNNFNHGGCSVNSDTTQEEFSLEAKAKRDFNSNSAIRDEFINIDRYVAFCKAEARGNITICGAGVVTGDK